MTKNLIEDLSTLTTVKESTLEQLFSKIKLIIEHDLKEAQLNNQDSLEVDLYIGTLLIKFTQDEIKYKFIPDSKFETELKATLTKQGSPLVLEVEEVLKHKILNVYKDLF